MNIKEEANRAIIISILEKIIEMKKEIRDLKKMAELKTEEDSEGGD